LSPKTSVVADSNFWDRVHAAARKSNRAYLATTDNGQPRVRVVFPAFENRVLWIATKPSSAKAVHIARDSRVELFYEVGTERPITHLTVTGQARLIDDLDEKVRVWNLRIFGYDLREFWPSGPDSRDLSLIRIDPLRIELGTQPLMWQGQKPEVWRA
jgi:general stress protein 26